MTMLKKLLNFLISILIKLKILNLKKNILRVLMFHDISNIAKFENQIISLKKSWKFINPKDFEEICLGKKKIKNKQLLLTFDDGFKSNFVVARNILKKLNIKAIFFIPFEFISKKNKKEKKKFIKNNLKIKNYKKTHDNMNLNDLKSLLKMKHSIGAHTFSHRNLKYVNNKKMLNYEIIKSADKFQKILNTKIEYFAFNFGRIKQISPLMVKIASKRFKILFTGIRGDNLANSKIAYRDNISSDDKLIDIEVYLSGYYDFIYKKERAIVKSFNKYFKQ